MSVTKYQVLARYYNTHTNVAITNDEKNQYDRKINFYTKDASEEITNLIMDGNDPQNEKKDMLFAYNGTVKLFPTDGSIEYVTEIAKIRKENTELNAKIANLNSRISVLNTSISNTTSEINNANTQLDVSSPSSAVYLENYYRNLANTHSQDLSVYQNAQRILDSNIYYDSFPPSFDSNSDGSIALKIEIKYCCSLGYHTYITFNYPSYFDDKTYKNISNKSFDDGHINLDRTRNKKNYTLTHQDYVEMSQSSVYLDCISKAKYYVSTVVDKLSSESNDYISQSNYYKQVKENAQSSLQRYTSLKVQYEQEKQQLLNLISQYQATIDSNNAYTTQQGDETFDPENGWPYLIIDTYKRVWFSPWFNVHICDSLQAAIQKAKPIVKSIGMNNVKVVKIVDINQRVKIK